MYNCQKYVNCFCVKKSFNYNVSHMELPWSSFRCGRQLDVIMRGKFFSFSFLPHDLTDFPLGVCYDVLDQKKFISWTQRYETFIILVYSNDVNMKSFQRNLEIKSTVFKKFTIQQSDASRPQLFIFYQSLIYDVLEGGGGGCIKT